MSSLPQAKCRGLRGSVISNMTVLLSSGVIRRQIGCMLDNGEVAVRTTKDHVATGYKDIMRCEYVGGDVDSVLTLRLTGRKYWHK